MTTWQQFSEHLEATYAVSQRETNSLGLPVAYRLDFAIGSEGEVQQSVFVLRGTFDDGEEWVVLQAPIARRNEVDPVRVLEEFAGMVVGGLSLHDDVYVLTHAVHLESLDLDVLPTQFEKVVVPAGVVHQRVIEG